MKVADVLGIWPSKKPKLKRIMLSRSDGSQFRVAVFERYILPGTIPLASAPVVMWIHGGYCLVKFDWGYAIVFCTQGNRATELQENRAIDLLLHEIIFSLIGNEVV